MQAAIESIVQANRPKGDERTRVQQNADAFVQLCDNQLAAGSLPRDSFLHYLRQDYVFLLHFARSWALVFAKSDRMSEMALASSIAHGLLNGEMPFVEDPRGMAAVGLVPCQATEFGGGQILADGKCGHGEPPGPS